MLNYKFASESVASGHPDKVADQISDAILDAYLAQSPDSRVACEVMVSADLIVLGGEITSEAQVDHEAVARQVVIDIGYDSRSKGLDARSCRVVDVIGCQSRDIAQGVDVSKDKSQGAGDQGLMFGYACNETPELMPSPIMFAHRLVRCLKELREEGVLPYLCPDGKAQVVCDYVDGVVQKVDSVVVSTQHLPSVDVSDLRHDILENVIQNVIPSDLFNPCLKGSNWYVNPTGRFVIGGPAGDCGLTGRKIVVDTYGGMARHGGGAFSGKDASKVDRSGAYMARFLAKKVVHERLAQKCEVQLSYGIGLSDPLSVYVDTYGSGSVEESLDLISQYDLTPLGIIDFLDLKKPVFLPTAVFGHFGRESFSWENMSLD